MAVLTGILIKGLLFTSFNPRISADGHDFDRIGFPYFIEDVFSPVLAGPVSYTADVSVPARREVPGAKLNSYLQDYYFRVHVRPSEVNLGNMLSAETRQVEVWNAYTVSKNLASITALNADNLNLVDPLSLPDTFSANESRIYTLSIPIEGSPAINATYLFNFPSESPPLRIVGQRVVVWPFVPQTKFRERLEWLTDILQPYAAEQRLALRVAPRQSLQYDFQLDPWQYSRAKALSSAWAFRVYGIGVWAEATRLGAVLSGVTSVNLNTTNADYRANDIILLWESDTKFLAVEITSIASGAISLKKPLAMSFLNAFVMPLRVARTLQGSEFSRSNTDITKMRATFQVDRNKDLAGSGYVSAFPQYRGKDVLIDRSVVLGELSERISRSLDIFDNGSAPIVVIPSRGYMDRRETLTFDPQNRTEVWAMRKWLHARRGKQKTFWLPSWNNDLALVKNILASDITISVKGINYASYYGVTDIMVQRTDGTRAFKRALSGAVDVNGDDVLTLESAFGVAIPISSVAFISFIRHVRFDSDSLDLAHDYAGRVSLTVPVIEVPEGN